MSAQWQGAVLFNTKSEHLSSVPSLQFLDWFCLPGPQVGSSPIPIQFPTFSHGPSWAFPTILNTIRMTMVYNWSTFQDLVVTLKYRPSLRLIPLDFLDNRHRSQKQKPLTHWLPSGHLTCAPQCFGSNNREMDWPWISKCAEDVSVKFSPIITNVFPIVSNVNWMKDIIVGQSILWFK